MTHQWTNENIDWAVNCCLELYQKGIISFSIKIFPPNIPGTKGTGTRKADRYELLNFALNQILSKNKVLKGYRTGGIGKSTSLINLISAHDPDGYFDSGLLCWPELWQIPRDTVGEEYMTPLVKLANLHGYWPESPQQLILDNQITFNESKGMWSEIVNLFCIKQSKGFITKADLYNSVWDKDFAEHIFLRASILIAFYKVVKIGWNLEDLTFGGSYKNHNELFMDIIWRQHYDFLINEIFPPPINPVTTYNQLKKVHGYKALGENNYAPKGQGSGNDYTKESAHKAADALWQLWQRNLRMVKEDAEFAEGLPIDEALRTNRNPELVQAIANWQQEKELRRSHEIKRFNRLRNEKNKDIQKLQM